jgi:hypothetical protein
LSSHAKTVLRGFKKTHQVNAFSLMRLRQKIMRLITGKVEGVKELAVVHNTSKIHSMVFIDFFLFLLFRRPIFNFTILSALV